MNANRYGPHCMDSRLCFLCISAVCLFVLAAGLPGVAAESPRAWAEKLAQSEMKRQGNALSFGSSPKAKWAYETGVFLKGLEAVWVSTGNTEYFDYLKSVVDSYLEQDGTIKTYNLEDYSLDNINCGKLLLSLYQKTREEKYKNAALLLLKQLETHPRTREGGFWHKNIYPYQMWLDGIYMASPFLAQSAGMFNKPAGFDDVANQIIWIESHTRDRRTGLLYHGWDESRTQEWADPNTGRSKSFWGRAIGWYAMGIADVLDFMPEKHPRRAALIHIFKRLAEAVANYQDGETGLWYQVLDQRKRDRNYFEASASSMFVYALVKGVRQGYLGGKYASVATKGYAGLLNKLIKVDAGGTVNLTQVCSVAGLGGPQKRNGTFEYYVSEPVVTNDLKGVGAFIMASVEIDKLAATLFSEQ